VGVRDWALAALALVATWFEVSVGPAVPAPAPVPGAIAGLAGLVGAAALAWRRRHPVPAVAVATVAFGLHDLLAGPNVPVAGWLAVYAIARHAPDLRGAVRGAVACAVAVAGANAAAGVIRDRTGGIPLVLALTGVVLLSAVLVRVQAARAQGRIREREAARQQAAAAERLRIAWDLHDLVGHGLSTVAVQSGAARLALDSGDPAAARRAVVSIEAASRDALAEMRQILGVLRAGDGDPAPAPGLDDVDALADRARRAGNPVTVQRAGPLDAVPAVAALTAYRAVQEALTNAARHAPGSAVTVSLAAAPGRLTVEVTNDGTVTTHGAADPDRPRYGLLGLRERVAAAGGTVEAGPGAGGPGWRVAVNLPLEPGTEEAAG
jgi:signal transduction histidine kinase